MSFFVSGTDSIVYSNGKCSYPREGSTHPLLSSPPPGGTHLKANARDTRRYSICKAKPMDVFSPCSILSAHGGSLTTNDRLPRGCWKPLAWLNQSTRCRNRCRRASISLCLYSRRDGQHTVVVQGRPYVFWKHRNRLRRDARIFVGSVCRKFLRRCAQKVDDDANGQRQFR